MDTYAQQYLPLSPATLHVLLALTDGELHGYGIMLEVARQSGGQYKIGPGTLYDNLKKLLSAGLVEESHPASSETGARAHFKSQYRGLGYWPRRSSGSAAYSATRGVPFASPRKGRDVYPPSPYLSPAPAPASYNVSQLIRLRDGA
jgi:hypothetical protein